MKENEIVGFLAGRDLAVEMLEAAPEADRGGRAMIELQYRDTVEQDIWTQKYLERAMQDPHMLKGFAAVLADLLASGGGAHPSVYAALTPGEIFGPHVDQAFTKFMGFAQSCPNPGARG